MSLLSWRLETEELRYLRNTDQECDGGFLASSAASCAALTTVAPVFRLVIAEINFLCLRTTHGDTKLLLASQAALERSVAKIN